jgi:hypothetical protein
MKIFVVTAILVALYLLYRIAFPKPPATGTGAGTDRKIFPNREANAGDGVKKSRYVSACRRQPQPTPATPKNSDKQDENAHIFAAGNEKTSTVIPPEKLDEVFGEEPDPKDLDIETDEENETDSPDLDGEEADEELRQTLGRDAEPAGDFSVEEMEEAAKAVDSPSDKNAAILYRVEKTDMFEKLVSGDQGKAARIKAVIDSYTRCLNPEVENEESNGNSDWENFDMGKYIVQTVKNKRK